MIGDVSREILGWPFFDVLWMPCFLTIDVRLVWTHEHIHLLVGAHRILDRRFHREDVPAERRHHLR